MERRPYLLVCFESFTVLPSFFFTQAMCKGCSSFALPGDQQDLHCWVKASRGHPMGHRRDSRGQEQLFTCSLFVKSALARGILERHCNQNARN